MTFKRNQNIFKKNSIQKNTPSYTHRASYNAHLASIEKESPRAAASPVVDTNRSAQCFWLKEWANSTNENR